MGIFSGQSNRYGRIDIRPGSLFVVTEVDIAIELYSFAIGPNIEGCATARIDDVAFAFVIKLGLCRQRAGDIQYAAGH